ncbi:MAG: hypothetical protein QF577_09630 [Phycisphaerae bacterium]|nr:hypothetical protein [Phycisphaerae bacterium]
MVRHDVLRYLRRVSRRVLLRRMIESAGLGVILAGLASAAVQAVCWAAGWPHRSITVVLVPLGAIVAAVWALVRGVRPGETAAIVDRRAGLDERLTTAGELAQSGCEDAAARCVYAQMLEAVGSVRLGRVSLWRRTRRTAGAAVLVVLLCAAVAMLPPRRGAAERIGDSLGGLPQAVRKELARALAEAGTDRPQHGRLLAEAARAVEVKDAETLRRILNDLEARGVKVRRIIGPDVLARAAGAGGGEDATGVARSRPAAGGGNGGGVVRVWDPLYAKVAAEGPPSGDRGDGVGETPMVPYEDAWAAARRRAAEALVGDTVPAEYRRMVREFFAEGR